MGVLVDCLLATVLAAALILTVSGTVSGLTPLQRIKE